MKFESLSPEKFAEKLQNLTKVASSAIELRALRHHVPVFVVEESHPVLRSAVLAELSFVHEDTEYTTQQQVLFDKNNTADLTKLTLWEILVNQQQPNITAIVSRRIGSL